MALRTIIGRSVSLIWLASTLLIAAPCSLADHPPPIAFGENIVAERSGGIGTTGVDFQFFDPVRDEENGRVNANIVQFPTHLRLISSGAAGQSCAFFGSCGFYILNHLGSDQLIFRIGSAEQNNGDTVFSAPAVVNFEIVESIDAPIGFDQLAGTYENTPVPIRPGGTAPAPRNSQLSYAIVDAPQNGTLDISSNRLRQPIVYTPDANFNGVDQFTFTVTDFTTVSKPARVQIVVGDSDAPIITSIHPRTGATTGDKEVTLTGANLLAGITQISFGDALVTSPLIFVNNSTVRFTTPPGSEGTVDVAISTPEGNAVLPASFTYETAVNALVSAVLPAARSVQVGADATAFGVIVNAGNTTLKDCRITPASQIDATFAFQETDPVTNALAGAENSPAHTQFRGYANRRRTNFSVRGRRHRPFVNRYKHATAICLFYAGARCHRDGCGSHDRTAPGHALAGRDGESRLFCCCHHKRWGRWQHRC